MRMTVQDISLTNGHLNKESEPLICHFDLCGVAKVCGKFPVFVLFSAVDVQRLRLVVGQAHQYHDFIPGSILHRLCLQMTSLQCKTTRLTAGIFETV